MNTNIITAVVVAASAIGIGAMIYGTSVKKAGEETTQSTSTSNLNRFEPVVLTGSVAGLPQKVDGKVLVVDVFNYGCGHCAVIHSINDEVYKRNADKIHLVKISAPFAQWNQYTHLFYALNSLGIEDKVSPDIFSAIHEKKVKDLNLGSQALTDILNKHKVSIEEFTKAYNDPSIPEKVAQSLEVLKAYKIESTPTMIVDNEKKFGPSINQGYAEAAFAMENSIKENFDKISKK